MNLDDELGFRKETAAVMDDVVEPSAWQSLYFNQFTAGTMQADVTYEEYRENARQQEARDRGAFDGSAPKEFFMVTDYGQSINYVPSDVAGWTVRWPV